MAVITVDATGENTIVVDPAANSALSAEHVERFRSLLRRSAVTLAQLEIPMEAVAVAARLAGGVSYSIRLRRRSFPLTSWPG